MAGVGAVALNSVVVWPWLGRVLSVRELAVLVSVLAAAALLAPASTLGLHAFVLRFLASSKREDHSSALSVLPVAGGIVLVVALAGGIVSTVSTSSAGHVLLWAGSGGAGMLAAAALRGQDRPWLFAIHAVSTQCLALGLVGVLHHSGVESSQALMIAAFTALGVSLLAVGTFSRRSGVLSALRAGCAFSLPLVPHLILIVGLVQMMRLVVSTGGIPEQTASFQFATLISGGAVTIMQGVGSHLTTDALRQSEESGFIDALGTACGRLSLTASVVVAAVGVFALTALPVWLPSTLDHDLVVACIGIMLVGVLAQAPGDIGMAALMRVGRTSHVSMATAGGAICAGVIYLASSSLEPAIAGSAAVSVGLVARSSLALTYSRREIGVRLLRLPLQPIPALLIFLGGTLVFLAYMK